MLKYEIYKIGEKPQNLVFFLHGYNGNIADHQYAIDWLIAKLDSAYLIIPEAPEICDKNPHKFQWFGMLEHDAQNLRTDPHTPTAQIFEIYQKAQSQIDRQAREINDFIDMLQNKYRFTDQQTYLIGFSQGAMLTIYVSLIRQTPIAGAFALSGLVAGDELLSQKITTAPHLYLFHGQNDLKVQYKTLEYTKNWLNLHHIQNQTYTYPGLAHKMTEAEFIEICRIINTPT